MFDFIINFFNNNNKKNQNFCNIYNEQYRNSYNKLWIEKIRNYSP